MFPSQALRSAVGEIDIYLFDQILRGRFDRRGSVLDAGCGDGRNLEYFLRNGFTCYAVDREPQAIRAVRALAAALAPAQAPDQFQPGELDALPFADGAMDAVICSAVLHFADDQAHFDRMLAEMWRVLAPGGLFFARLASNIGIESRVQPLQGRWFHLPDGSDRYLVDEAILMAWTRRLGAELLEPIKTVNVQGMRCMTTWVMRKKA